MLLELARSNPSGLASMSCCQVMWTEDSLGKKTRILPEAVVARIENMSNHGDDEVCRNLFQTSRGGHAFMVPRVLCLCLEEPSCLAGAIQITMSRFQYLH